MQVHLKALLLALQFLTRLPVPRLLETADYHDNRLAGLSVIYYPVTGLILGLLLIVGQGALILLFPQGASLLIAALLLAMWIALTGALHLDGLADSADAWLGGMGNPARTLEIMKDPRAGPAGVISLVVVLLIKFTALVSLIQNHAPPALLLLPPMLARSSAVSLFLTTAYARPNGMGEQASLNTPRQAAWLVIGLTLLSSFWLIGLDTIVLLTIVTLVFFLLRRRMIQRIGGMTGDTAGEMIEIIEAVVLIVLVLQV